MVATVVRLRLLLLRNMMSREIWRVILFGLGALWAVSMLPAVLGGARWLSGQETTVQSSSLVVVGAVLLVGWFVLPVLMFGADETVTPRKFATLGLDPRRLAPALVVAASMSIPAVFTGFVCLASVIVWRGYGLATTVVALAAALAAFATCVLAARVSTALATRLLSSRRARELAGVAAVVAVIAVVPLLIGLGSLGLEGTLERVPRVAAVLSYTPFGAAWGAPAAAAQGAWSAAIGQLLLAWGFVGLGLLVWTRQVDRLLVDPPSTVGASRRRADAFLGAGSGPTTTAHATLAVARRSLRYWLGDPRYLASLASTLLMPLLIALLLSVVGLEAVSGGVLLAPLVAGAVGWGRHNDTAFDGTAFWMHVSAGLPGIADRAGRVLALAAWALPLVVGLAVGGAWLADRWDLLGASLGLALGLFGAGLGVAMVSSVLLPYPAPRAGESPFSTETGAVGASLVAQLLSTAVTGVLAVPVTVLFWLTVTRSPGLAGVTLAVGLLGGAVVLAAGIVLGGRLLDARGAQLLARLH
ncbi:MAG: hypothetical protein GX593_02355 [Actinomycetales bacterium]|nr:hypothetical protein [Actinomycetales bacterium]